MKDPNHNRAIIFFFLCLLTVLFASKSHAQKTVKRTNNITIKDTLGNVLSTQEFVELANRNFTTLETNVLGDNVEIVVTAIPKEKTPAYARQWINKLKGTSFPEFKLSDLAGKQVTRKDFEGKIVVLNFWSVKARPTIDETPELNTLVKKYEDQNVLFIAPALDSRDSILKLMPKYESKYRILTDAVDLSAALTIERFPSHVIVDDGKIIELFPASSGDVFFKLDIMIGTLVSSHSKMK
jgi:peroxiredoxin